MDRRAFLSSTVAALAASQIASPSWARDKPLKLGFLIPKSGPAGIFGPSSETTTALALEEINASGGILGRPVEALFGDAGGAPSDTVQAAQRLWRRDGVQALIGQHDSASREAVAAMLRGQLTYVYTPVNEGGYCHPNTYSLGETPDQQLAPVIPWLAGKHDLKKWYLIGNDYVWPRGTNAAAKTYIADTGGEIVGEEYHPFTVDNFDTSLTRIRESGADAVLITLVGGASVTFNRAFASFGLDKQAIRLGTLIEENTLAGIGAGNSNGIYATAGYFDALDTPAAAAFRKTYYARFGADAPVLNTLGEGCYEGAMALRAMFEAAGSTETDAVAAAANGVSYTGPRGTTTLSDGFAASDIYLASANGAGFEIIQRFENVAPGNACTTG